MGISVETRKGSESVSYKAFIPQEYFLEGEERRFEQLVISVVLRHKRIVTIEHRSK